MSVSTDTEPLADLIEATMLTDRHTLMRTVAYAIEHSMSAHHNMHFTKQAGSVSARLCSVFDWFVTLARAFAVVPMGIFRYSGDSLWVSKDVVVSLEILGAKNPDLVSRLRATYTEGRKYPCGPAAKRVLQEVHFEGELLRHVMSEPSFNSGGAFSSGKSLIMYALQHARNLSKPLVSLELICASAFTSWSMVTWNDMAPWERNWRSNEARFQEGVVTFRGQRRAVAMFFNHTDNGSCLAAASRGELPVDSRAFRGMWLLGSGTDNSFRGVLLSRTPPALVWSSWASFLSPWMALGFAEDSLTRSAPTNRHWSARRSTKLIKVRRLLQFAAVLDAAPEAYDVCVNAWLEDHGTPRKRLVRFPHLRHVAEKRLRYESRFYPPDVLCEDIIDTALAFVN